MDGTPNQKINVTLTRGDQGGTTVWLMDIAGQGKGGPNGYPPAKVDHGSGADFKFMITGQGTQNITFSNDPIWVDVDTGAGTSPAGPGIKSDQIIGVQKSGGGKTLSFTDTNTSVTNLTYQLNFTGADPLDPIIQNNGGGGNKDLSSAVYALIGLAVLATLALIWLRARARSRATNGEA